MQDAQALALLRQLYNEFMLTDGGELVKRLYAAPNKEQIIRAAPSVWRKVQVTEQVEQYLDRWEHTV